ncbi:MAG: hypothetical protein PQJ49_14590 [Sphaerochaetaceae bacterium]|nr:hypothetical protein [Sphaerochaetaceae bacterium]
MNDAVTNLGLDSVQTFEDGTLVLNDINKDEMQIASLNGTALVSKSKLKQDLAEGKFYELNKKFDGFLDTAYTLFMEDNSVYKESKVVEETEDREDDLRITLLDTLNKLGVKVTSISDYIENYNTRNNIDPSVEALADISQSLVAFAEGKNNVENLAEETAHFVIEGFTDQAAIEEILPLVEDTTQWKDNSERYYNKYSELYSGQELDNIVRREVLGKILKDKIIDGFSTQEASVKETGVIQFLRDKWNQFLTMIRSFYTPTLSRDVKSVTDYLASKVLDKEIENYFDPEAVKASKFTLYSLNDKRAIVTISKAREQLEKRLVTLKQSKDVTTTKVQQDINKLSQAINNADEWHGVKVIVSAVDPQVKNIKRQIDKYNDLQKDDSQVAYFTQEEKAAFDSLVNDFLPILEELRAIVDKELQPIEGVNKEVTINQIDNLVKEISLLKGEVALQVSKDKNSIANRIMAQYGLNEEERANLEALIERDLEDTSWFQRNFGSLEHSSNPFLGMLGKIINENNNKANRHLIRDINPFLKKVDDENWDLNKMQSLLEKDGKEFTSFTKSPYSWAKFNAAEREAEVKAFNKVFKTDLDVEQYNRNLRDRKIKRKSDFTPEELNEFNTEMAKWYEDNTEKRYVKEFYDQKKKMYDDLGISTETREFLQNLSIRRYYIISKYLSPNNELDYSKISARDLQQLSILTQERKAEKSEIDAETGEVKTGTALKVSQDLKKLDENYQNNKRDFSIKDSFYETIERVETEQGSQAAFDWLKVNGGIIFNDNFWNSLSEGRSTLLEKIDILKDEIQEESIEDYDKISEGQAKLADLLKKKTEILKQYQVANNPSEIDFDNMSGQVVENIRNIESELQTAFRDVNSILRKYDSNEVEDPTVLTENTVNEAYNSALEDSSKNELNFILDHVTEADKNNIREVQRRIDKIKGGSDFIDRTTRRFLESYFKQGEMTSEEIQEAIADIDTETLTIAYGKTRVLPYFRRFAPLGYDAFLNQLKTGVRSVSQFVRQSRTEPQSTTDLNSDITNFLSVNTQFSWTEDEAGASMLNPNYDENFEGGIRQPKLDKYLNDEFFSEFGIDKTQYKLTKELNPTRNIQKFSMLEDLWDIKRKGLEAYNEQGSQSIYKIPQVSKGLSEKTRDFVRKNPTKTVGNAIKDIIYNRVDDLGYGERIDGEDVRNMSDVRLIPKYYLRDLEETSDVSTELAYSYSMYLQAAYTYRERLATVSDAMVLEQKLLDSKFVGGKSAESTKAYDMFKNFLDSYFFGIKRSRKFMITLPNGKQLDVSKMAILFDRFVRYVNIGFSLPIAATSLVTAEVFLRIENHIGEHTNKNSASWATKEFRKLTPKFVSEVGAINKESRLNKLAERFRVFNLTDRTTSSGFNKIVRAANHLPYKFSEIANYPIAPRIMLTILDDFRLVGDQFTDFNSFKKRSDVQGMDKKALLNEWNKYRETSMYNLLEDVDGTVDFSQDLKDRLGEDYLEEQLSRIQGRISRVNANVDSVVPQEDKSAATRDFLMNFMTAHRGWLSIAIQRKFKKAHFNFNTGQFEEGHYRTLARYLKDGFALMEEKNMKNFIKTFKEHYNTLDDFEKRNLKRIMAELGVYMFLLGFGIIVAAIADDDDNKDLWALQFSSYIYFRTVSEIGSVQAPTGVYGLVDTVQAPFIAINSIKDILDPKGFSFEEVQSGAYEGHSKLYKKLAKQTWLRHLYDLKGIKKKSDYYRLLNAETLFHLSE